MKNKNEWGKRSSNVVMFRLYMQTGMCVYPSTSKISSVSSHPFHTSVSFFSTSLALCSHDSIILLHDSLIWFSLCSTCFSFSISLSCFIPFCFPLRSFTPCLFPLSQYLSLLLAMSSSPSHFCIFLLPFSAVSFSSYRLKPMYEAKSWLVN